MKVRTIGLYDEYLIKCDYCDNEIWRHAYTLDRTCDECKEAK